MEQDDERPEDEMKRELEEKVALAAEIAGRAPDFRERAFDKILDFLLQGGSGSVSRRARQRDSREARPGRRALKASPNAHERIRPILDAPPEIASEYPELLSLDAKAKIYRLLWIGREKFQIDGLTVPELRVVANEKLRIGIPDGTLRGTLSKAPATEIGRATGAGDETLYRLLLPGEAYLKDALMKLETRSLNRPPNSSG